jgi:hypothetical protein
MLRHWNIVQYSLDCKDTFPSTLIIWYRRGRNLKLILVRAQVAYPPLVPIPKWDTVRPEVCKRLGKCTYCPKILKSDKFISFVTHRPYNILYIPNHRHMSCEITNIIYLISCAKCGLQYVRETGRRARDRLYGHLYRSRAVKFKPRSPGTSPPLGTHTHRPKVPGD